MATFTILDDADLAVIAAVFDIGRLARGHAIEAGTVNSNYALHTDRGRYFVRVNEGKTTRAVRYEAELVAALASAGTPTPVPLGTATGERYCIHRGKLVSVFPWVRGTHRSSGAVTAADAHAVGAALGQLHLVGLELADQFAHASIYTTDRIAERFRGFRDSNDPELTVAIESIGEELAYLSDHAADREAAPRGIIHGDLFADNVMFDGDRISALIDFEQASTGTLVYDLAVCLNAWCYGEAFDSQLVTAMLIGYRSVRELDRAERRSLLVEARAAAMRFAVTRITDVYLPGVELAGKDFRRYLDRLACWRGDGRELLRSGVGTLVSPGVGSGE